MGKIFGHFTKDVWIANKHKKICSTLLGMREREIKLQDATTHPLELLKLKRLVSRVGDNWNYHILLLKK